MADSQRLGSCRKVQRGHQVGAGPHEQGLQDGADQAHVVVEREPADHHLFAGLIEGPLDQRLVGGQALEGDLHALGRGGRTGGVLKKGNAIAGIARGLPAGGILSAAVFHRQPANRGEVFEGRCEAGVLLQVSTATQGCYRAGIRGDGPQPGQRPAGLGRIGRHRDCARQQAAEKADHKIEARGKEQQGPLTRRPGGLELGSDLPGPAIELLVGKPAVDVPLELLRRRSRDLALPASRRYKPPWWEDSRARCSRRSRIEDIGGEAMTPRLAIKNSFLELDQKKQKNG